MEEFISGERSITFVLQIFQLSVSLYLLLENFALWAVLQRECNARFNISTSSNNSYTRHLEDILQILYRNELPKLFQHCLADC